MIIGVDIDEIVADFTGMVLDELKERHGISLDKSQWTSWNLYEVPGFRQHHSVIKETISNMYKEGKMKHLRLVPEAREALNELADSHELIFITAREKFFPEAKAHTLHWFQKHNIPFHSMHFAHEKDGLAKELGVELFIEDSASNALALASAGIHVLLMDTPWNQGADHELITRVQNWQEIKDEITGRTARQ